MPFLGQEEQKLGEEDGEEEKEETYGEKEYNIEDFKRDRIKSHTKDEEIETVIPFDFTIKPANDKIDKTFADLIQISFKSVEDNELLMQRDRAAGKPCC